ncbi:hypothetical protein A4R26_05395 [Niastella populi]|uniref:DUF4397 domain-containing protein n=2 Tax=Niastella populi TaxID=550983 RepID=A0A1V9FDZ6_9BACT|nr:hypothetical protein A4R26_05395 [Niastella populi]
MSYTTVALNAVTIDSLRLIVSDNGTVLTDTLYTPQGYQLLQVKYTEPRRRYRVTDMYSNSLLLDTVVSYKTVSLNAVTFFQPMAGGKLVWIGPPVNEPAPAEGKIKLSVVYASPFTTSAYDEIKVVVENSKTGNSANDYEATDSFYLKRGDFSPFFSGGGTRKPRLRLYANDGSDILLGTINPAALSEANADYSIYYISFNSATSASVTKLY